MYLLSVITTECSKASDKNALQKYTILPLTDNSHSSGSYTSEMQLPTYLTGKHSVTKKTIVFRATSQKHNTIFILKETVFQDIKQVLGSFKAEVHFPNYAIKNLSNVSRICLIEK